MCGTPSTVESREDAHARYKLVLETRVQFQVRVYCRLRATAIKVYGRGSRVQGPRTKFSLVALRYYELRYDTIDYR